MILLIFEKIGKSSKNLTSSIDRLIDNVQIFLVTSGNDQSINQSINLKRKLSFILANHLCVCVCVCLFVCLSIKIVGCLIIIIIIICFVSADSRKKKKVKFFIFKKNENKNSFKKNQQQQKQIFTFHIRNGCFFFLCFKWTGESFSIEIHSQTDSADNIASK